MEDDVLAFALECDLTFALGGCASNGASIRELVGRMKSTCRDDEGIATELLTLACVDHGCTRLGSSDFCEVFDSANLGIREGNC